jgi:hypothetical protein
MADGTNRQAIEVVPAKKRRRPSRARKGKHDILSDLHAPKLGQQARPACLAQDPTNGGLRPSRSTIE